MICTVLLVLLGTSELKSYLQSSTSSELVLATTHGADKFRINMNIEFPNLPCDIISLDVEDSMGYHVTDYYGELHKERLSVDGETLSTESWSEKNSVRRELIDRVKKELDEN